LDHTCASSFCCRSMLPITRTCPVYGVRMAALSTSPPSCSATSALPCAARASARPAGRETQCWRVRGAAQTTMTGTGRRAPVVAMQSRRDAGCRKQPLLQRSRQAVPQRPYFRVGRAPRPTSAHKCLCSAGLQRKECATRVGSVSPLLRRPRVARAAPAARAGARGAARGDSPFAGQRAHRTASFASSRFA
jgi:hypothetical protein